MSGWPFPHHSFITGGFHHQACTVSWGLQVTIKLVKPQPIFHVQHSSNSACLQGLPTACRQSAVCCLEVQRWSNFWDIPHSSCRPHMRAIYIEALLLWVALADASLVQVSSAPRYSQPQQPLPRSLKYIQYQKHSSPSTITTARATQVRLCDQTETFDLDSIR